MAFFSKTFAKLTQGLARTRDRFFGGLKSFLTGRKLDEALLDELEEKLIEADMGVATATRIREDLQAAYKEKRITRGDEVIDFLKAELKSYWPATNRQIRMAPHKPTVILVAGINGAGKTTSIAKLAYQDRKSVV